MAFQVELELAGSTWTLDDKHIIVSDFTERLSLFGSTPALSSASVRAIGLPLAQLRSQGHKIAGAVGRLYLDGDLLFTGTVSNPTYGAETEPVFFSIREGAYQDTALIPTLTETITEATMAKFAGTIEAERVGLSYPQIFGRPVTPLFGVAAVRCTPSPQATTGGSRVIVLCRGVVPSTLTGVALFNDTTSTSASGTLVAVSDGLGQTLTNIVPSVAPGAGDVLWAGLGLDGGPTSVLDVADLLLRHSSLTVDHGRLAALRALSFKVDSYINTPTSPWGWLQANVLAYVPVSSISTPRGLAFVVHDLNPAVGEATRTFIEGTNAWRLTQVEIGSETEVINEVSVKYGPDYEGTYRNTVTRTDARSVGLYGLRAREFTLNATQSLNTAETVTSYLLQRYAHPTEDIDYLTTETVALGDLVAIADPEIYFEDTLGWITARTVRPGLPTRVSVRLLPPATA